MSSRSLQGDPRRPGNLYPFVREPVNPDDAPGDWYAFFSLVLGFLAFIMKVRFVTILLDSLPRDPITIECLYMDVYLVEGNGVGLAPVVHGFVHQHEVAGHEHNADCHVVLLLHECSRVGLHGYHASWNAPVFVDSDG